MNTHSTTSNEGWEDIATAPEAKTVWTKIHDRDGERNVQMLRRSGRLWFVPDGSTYVYYSPTHWSWQRPSEQGK